METPSRDVVRIFERLGLTRYETSVLLALVLSNDYPLDYKDILCETDVPYGKVHSTLMGLERKGLITNHGGRPKRYSSKPMGEIVENYFVSPMLESLSGSKSGVDRQLADLWTRQVTTIVPIVHMDDETGEQMIEFVSGLDNLREREHREAAKAKETLRLCLPSSGFLDRRRPDALRIGDSVRTEIVTTIDPQKFVKILAPDERASWRQAFVSNGGLHRTRYYLAPQLDERMVIIDDHFAALGTSMLPVTLHIYSRKLCKSVIERFEERKKASKLVDFS